MAADAAESERKPEADSRPKSVEEQPDTATATGTTAAAPGGGTLGERQVQTKAASSGAALGATDDPAERAADTAADRVMRMPEPSAAVEPPKAAGPPAPAPLVQRQAAAPEERTPGGAAVSQVATSAGSAPIAPEVAAPAAADDRPGPAETGTPAPDPEPPAPEGEQPARGTPVVPPEVQEYLDASRGKGAPLPEKARRSMEAGFRRGFADVRIHAAADADAAARKIDALAFTRGNDVYFRAGAFDPDTDPGKRLLAHELAHVVQQRPGINRMIRRKPAPGLGGNIVRRAAEGGGQPDGKKDPQDVHRGAEKLGEIDVDDTKLTLEKVRIPRFKLKHHRGPLSWTRPAGSGILRSGGHTDAWTTAAAAVLITPVQRHAQDLNLTEPYYLQFGKGSKARLFVGSAVDIAHALSRLPWNARKEPHNYQIDHKRELQLGGDDTSAGNLWLLDASINASSGATINNAIRADIKALLAAAKLTRTPSFEEVERWAAVKDKVVFRESVPDERPTGSTIATDAGGEVESWDIPSGDGRQLATAPMDALVRMDDENLKKVKGTENELSIFSRRGGGSPRKAAQADGKIKEFFGPGYKIMRGTYLRRDPPVPGPVGTLDVGFFSGKRGQRTLIEPVSLRDLPIQPMPGVDYGGLFDSAPIYTAMREARPKTPIASPISFDWVDFDFDTGLSARGVVPKPSLKLLENVRIGVFVSGDDIGLDAAITGDSLKLPGPLKVSGGVLTLVASIEQGIKVEGRIDFEIEGLAKGWVEAEKGTSAEFALEGELNFDTEMFTKAQLGLSYKAGQWGVSGELAVGPGKVKGIKSASAMVEVDDETVAAKGEFETSIKGVKKGQLGFRYDPARGMEITGIIELGEGIPGVKSGKLDAIVKQGTDGYTLAGGVTIAPSVPGLAGSITGRYEDGAFLVEADLGYELGIAKGSVRVGVTNQPVGADGKPAGPAQPDGGLSVYGGGTVTLAITPWLQGTVGLRLRPNGEIEVSGEVALPSAFEVFPQKKVDKRVFSIGIDLPIVGVAVAGQRIGIFATIRGGLDVGASFGPGQLRDVALEVTYNPARPETTTVRGMGAFHVPALAGLRLSVDGGLGAGIPIVSATAGVTIFGEVGVEGAAVANVAVNWTPSAGIVLDARGEIFVQPKFKFGIDAFVDVSADLLLKKIELYHNKWNLAAFEYGPDLRFGLVFPIHYESGKPFELSFDQIQWTYPQIDPGELLGGLMKQLVG